MQSKSKIKGIIEAKKKKTLPADIMKFKEQYDKSPTKVTIRYTDNDPPFKQPQSRLGQSYKANHTTLNETKVHANYYKLARGRKPVGELKHG